MTAIRAVSTADAPAVAELLRTCGAGRRRAGAPVRAGELSWEQRLADPATAAVAVDDDDHLAAFACAVPIEERRVEMAVAVHPRARGRGHAARLLRQLVTVVAERDYDEAELWTGRDDEPARRLCARSGWRPVDASDTLVRHEAALLELLGAMPREPAWSGARRAG